jgi:hypothetical protein
VVTIEIGGGLGIGTGSGLGIIDQFEVDTGTRAVIEGEGPQNTEEPFLTRALKEATRLLQENADCANLFGGQQKAMKKLRELKFISGTVNKGDIAKIDGNKVWASRLISGNPPALEAIPGQRLHQALPKSPARRSGLL